MTDNEIIKRRVLLGLIGAVAGICFWILFDVLDRDVLLERIVLGATALTFSFFGPLLGLIGPLSPKRALLSALMVSIPSSVLFVWASFRFEKVDDYLSSGLPMAAFALLITLPLPFLISWGSGRGWRHYPTLFMEAWGFAVRYAAAWVFVLLFWLVLLLSDGLLKLVGVRLIDMLLEVDWFVFALMGGVLGLAIAVVDELSDYVSPNLILRLLRLLMPLLLGIVVIFVVAIPFRGLSELFGSFSAATVLTAIVIVAATLITTALDTADPDAVKSPIMRGSAQVLAMLMPVLSGLASYAVWLRVDQYGWTPDRMAAAALVLVFLGYSILYALAVLRRGEWMENIRRANVVKAIVIVVVAALWLTPVLNVNRISATSQVARLQKDKVTPQEFDVWALTHEWGRDGARVADAVEAGDYGQIDPVVLTRLETARKTERSYEFRRVEREGSQSENRAILLEKLKVMPSGVPISDDQLSLISTFDLGKIAKSCGQKTGARNPACIAVKGIFRLEYGEEEVVLFYLAPGRTLQTRVLGDTRISKSTRIIGGRVASGTGAIIIDAIRNGEFTMAPVPLNALSVNGEQIYIMP